MNNQSFPAYSSSESTSSLANGKLINGQTYDYYDNTSAVLLENDHYSRNSNHYQKPSKTRNSQACKDDHYNPYDHETMGHEEPYMNDGDELCNLNSSNSNNNVSSLKKNVHSAKRVVIVNNKKYTLDDNESDQNNGDQDSISGSGSLPKSGSGSGGSGVDSSENGISAHSTAKISKSGPPVPKQTLTNSTAIFNNNVCVALGSGVESINKRLNSTGTHGNNYVKSFKPQNLSNSNVNKSNYSTVDSKNLKVAKVFKDVVSEGY